MARLSNGMDEFLKLEYEQCIGLLKHYDERHLSLVQFSAVLSSAVASTVFGFETLTPATTAPPRLVALLSAIAFAGLVSIYLAMVQNRLYFVFPARQANAIRKHVLQQSAEAFDNQMYLSTGVAAFKFRSLHSVMNAVVVLQAGGFAGLFLYAQGWSLAGAATLGLCVAVALFAGTGFYLKRRGAMSADDAVHRQPLSRGL